MAILSKRGNIFGVIARESGQSSTHRFLGTDAVLEPQANGVLDGPLSRAMTTQKSW
jgi:hypothetical protein